MKRRILFVEDNPGDVRLVQEAFKDSKIENEINVVHDGVQAMDYLWKKGAYAAAFRPDLILLDLNLPKKDGREILMEIKQNEEFKSIPVVILSSSNATADIRSTYDNYANCYIQKPINYDDYMEVIGRIEEFWFTIVKMPLKDREIR